MMSIQKKILHSSFCKNIKELRHERNWNQKYLAYRMGVSTPSVSKIESGVTDITISTMEQLAKIYEISIVELFTGTTDLSHLNALNKKLANHDAQISALQRKIIELYEELQHKNVPA